jgi:hypothetical protein
MTGKGTDLEVTSNASPDRSNGFGSSASTPAPRENWARD